MSLPSRTRQVPKTKDDLREFYARGLHAKCASCGAVAGAVIRVFAPAIELLADESLARWVVAKYGRQVPSFEAEDGTKYVRLSMNAYCTICLREAEIQAAKHGDRYLVNIDRGIQKGQDAQIAVTASLPTTR